MAEAVVDIRDCDFSNQDLSGKVFSGVLMRGADLTSSKVVGSQFARADAQVRAVMLLMLICKMPWVWQRNYTVYSSLLL